MTRFVKDQSRRAAADGDNPRARAVGFLMSLYQRRLASSTQAMRRSLENRAKRLADGLEQAQALADTAPPTLQISKNSTRWRMRNANAWRHCWTPSRWLATPSRYASREEAAGRNAAGGSEVSEGKEGIVLELGLSADLRYGEFSADLSRKEIGNLDMSWHCFHDAGIGIGPQGVG